MDESTSILLTDRLTHARNVLDQAGQPHVLEHFDMLTMREQEDLLNQIEGVDWPEVRRLVDSIVLGESKFQLPQQLDPAPWYPRVPPEDDPELIKKYGQARRIGEDLIRKGKVAAFTVAGGQGTRLGWDAPKGTFPATPIRKLPLFAVLAENLIKIRQKYGQSCPWYIMTSPINDQPTRDFFRLHNHFGLDERDVTFFPQGMLPAFLNDGPDIGRAILDSPSGLALSPNGHGGSLKALHTSGAISDMKQRGIEQISYTQIDNPLVKVIDPLFIGLHAIDECQMSSKMLPKAYPKEKLGNFCLANGRVTVIEYSDLPDELAEQRVDEVGGSPGASGGSGSGAGGGQLRFLAGSIAIHMIRVDFVESLNQTREGFALPYHRAQKKVPVWDPDTARRIDPASPNAVKLETFVFDALPLCERSIIYETDRVEEFAPIKNADGVDSPKTSYDLQIERAARWLQLRGVDIPRNELGHVDGVIEIRPTTAIEPDDLTEIDLPASVQPGQDLLI